MSTLFPDAVVRDFPGWKATVAAKWYRVLEAEGRILGTGGNGFEAWLYPADIIALIDAAVKKDRARPRTS